MIVTPEKLSAAMRRRGNRPVFVIDLAVPRDVDPAVNKLDGVYLYDIDSLRLIAEQSLAVRRQELEACERLIERHVDEFSGVARDHAAIRCRRGGRIAARRPGLVMERLILGSRGSALALAQVELVKAALAAASPELQVEVADHRHLRRSPPGGALRRGVGTGGAERFVHQGNPGSAARRGDRRGDPQPEGPAGPDPRRVGARRRPPPRRYRRYAHFENARRACSPERASAPAACAARHQLRWKHPAVAVAELRGNVPTRLRKLAEDQELDGIVLARAGLDRLGYAIAGGEMRCEAGRFCVAEIDMLPAIGQGAIGIETRKGGEHALRRHRSTRPPIFAFAPSANCCGCSMEIAGLPVGMRTILRGD